MSNAELEVRKTIRKTYNGIKYKLEKHASFSQGSCSKMTLRDSAEILKTQGIV